MGTFAIKLAVEPLRLLAYSSITDDYIALGTPYVNPVRIYHLQNLTDVDLVYSWDGVTDHGVVAAGNFILLDVTANKSLDQGEFISAGWSTYIRSFSGLTPSVGSVYLTVFYGSTI
jgi:hypothetical protein